MTLIICEKGKHLLILTFTYYIIRLLIQYLIYATADEADAFMFYRCFFLFFLFSVFSVRQKIPDNRSRERLNGFSWNFYQTIAGKMEFASPYPNGG